jgi:hypothetical protein
MIATPLFATTVQQMDLPDLVSTADNIVQGHVESVETRFENRMIYTYATVVVDDLLKGDRRRSVVLRHIGGSIGSMAVAVSGMPHFKAGDQAILFLRNRRDGTFDVIGLNQGKYDIVGGSAVANVSGVTLVDPKTGQISDAGFKQTAPLDAFKAKIKELVR